MVIPYPRKKYSKKLYPAGMLSMAILPVVFIWLLSTWGMFNTAHGIEFYYYTPYNGDSAFVKQALKKKYVDVVLTDDNTKNLAAIILSKNYLNTLNEKYDTTKGIHFKFDGNLHHGTFVKIAELLNNERKFSYYQPMKNYVANDYDIWAFNSIFAPPPPDTTSDRMLGYCVYTCGHDSLYKLDNEKTEALISPTHPIMIVFFVLVISCIANIIQSILNKKKGF